MASHFRAARHRNKVFGPGKNKDVLRVVVARNTFRGLAADPRDTQAPAKPERPVAIASTVDELQLRLKAVGTGRQRDGDCEIPGPRVEIGRELLADALQRTSPFGRRNDLACRA